MAPNLAPDLSHVDAWIFDLDNTLYPPGSEFMALMEDRMTEFVMRETSLPRDQARALQKRYLNEHGTTLAGLMAHHGVEPEPFLTEVHDVSMDSLRRDEALRASIARLPGRRLVFTNGDERHAGRVLEHLDLADLFEAVFHIAAADYIPKPRAETFEKMIDRHRVEPRRAAFFEDSERNLKPAAEVGMTTVLVGPHAEAFERPFVHHRTRELAPFLAAARVKESLLTREAALEQEIDAAWEQRTELYEMTSGALRKSVEEAIGLLDAGRLRVAEKTGEDWVVRQWLKKAVLLSFRLHGNELMGGDAGINRDPGTGPWWDKVPSKFGDWTDRQFKDAGFRAVPGSVVRRGAFIGKSVVLMPSFVNIGAFVDEGTMVDTWATVGSCAQIGRNVHLSGGAGIGGVLEPLQAGPTIIEDDCFIGARSEVAEGVVVGQGAVLSMGVFIGQSTKIVDRASGEVFRGRVPPYSVVVPGSLPDPNGGPSLYCAVIVKRVDAQTRSKTSINELLRD